MGRRGGGGGGEREREREREREMFEGSWLYPNVMYQRS